MRHILLLNGPNMNLLGAREPQIYGTETLSSLVSSLQERGRELGIDVEHRQSNGEHLLIEAIQDSRGVKDFIIINPAALGHTSIILRDALLAVQVPFIEVHISNIYSREPFRHHSYLADIALGTISGLGVAGYHFALQAAASYLQPR